MRQMTVVMAEALHGELLQWLDVHGFELKPMPYDEPATFIAIPKTKRKRKVVKR